MTISSQQHCAFIVGYLENGLIDGVDCTECSVNVHENSFLFAENDQGICDNTYLTFDEPISQEWNKYYFSACLSDVNIKFNYSLH